MIFVKAYLLLFRVKNDDKVVRREETWDGCIMNEDTNDGYGGG